MVLTPNEVNKAGMTGKQERISELEKELEQDIDRVLVENRDRLKYTDSRKRVCCDLVIYKLSCFCITDSYRSASAGTWDKKERMITANIPLTEDERRGIVSRVEEKYKQSGWFCHAGLEGIAIGLPEWNNNHNEPDVYYNPD